MILLLFENILKNLYKLSQNMVEMDSNYLNNIEKGVYVDSLIKRFKEAIKEYQYYE